MYDSYSNKDHYDQDKGNNKSRVPDQNGVSQAWYIVEIHHSGREPSKCRNIFFFTSLTFAQQRHTRTPNTHTLVYKRTDPCTSVCKHTQTHFAQILESQLPVCQMQETNAHTHTHIHNAFPSINIHTMPSAPCSDARMHMCVRVYMYTHTHTHTHTHTPSPPPPPDITIPTTTHQFHKAVLELCQLGLELLVLRESTGQGGAIALHTLQQGRPVLHLGPHLLQLLLQLQHFALSLLQQPSTQDN